MQENYMELKRHKQLMPKVDIRPGMIKPLAFLLKNSHSPFEKSP